MLQSSPVLVAPVGHRDPVLVTIHHERRPFLQFAAIVAIADRPGFVGFLTAPDFTHPEIGNYRGEFSQGWYEKHPDTGKIELRAAKIQGTGWIPREVVFREEAGAPYKHLTGPWPGPDRVIEHQR